MLAVTSNGLIRNGLAIREVQDVDASDGQHRITHGIDHRFDHIVDFQRSCSVTFCANQ